MLDDKTKKCVTIFIEEGLRRAIPYQRSWRVRLWVWLTHKLRCDLWVRWDRMVIQRQLEDEEAGVK